ncbi:diguanylate phosphodiesterase, partial [Rhodopirellula maiorica SM1]
MRDGALQLTDLGSTNGTYVNGKRVEPHQSIRISEEDLIHFAEAPFRVYRQSVTGATNGTIAENICDQALALVQFDRLMSERLVRPHFQAIVDLNSDSHEMIGHEILGRGSVFGLESVGAMFQAAEQLSLEVELSRLLRWEGIRVGRDFPESPMLFVNTHPKEIGDVQGLIESLIKAREMAGNANLVLEIHESAVTNRAVMDDLVQVLESQNIRLA